MAQARLSLAAAALVFAASLLGGCRSGSNALPTELRRITSTTSFGMCVGYCTTRLDITEREAVLTRIGRGGRGAATLPDAVTRAPLATGEWRAFVRLADAARFDGLPAVIGCPDCADGGAETLSIETAAGAKSVSFEYGATVDGVAPLLQRVREKRMALSPKEE